MKDLIKALGIGVLSGIGVMLGYQIWDDCLEEKVDDFKIYLNNKRKEKKGA